MGVVYGLSVKEKLIKMRVFVKVWRRIFDLRSMRLVGHVTHIEKHKQNFGSQM
jgi:hypothetical protein